MSSLNKSARREPVFTHEGARASQINNEQQLRRSVMACLLWEDGFYEDGISVAERIQSLVAVVPPHKVAAIAIEARNAMKLRHVPLFLARCLVKVRSQLLTPAGRRKFDIEGLLAEIIQRPDELTEFIAMYDPRYANPSEKIRSMLPHAVKRGLAHAFEKFDAYQLAKYNRPSEVKLKDVMKLVHPKHTSEEQSRLWKRLLGGYCEVCWRGKWEHPSDEHDFIEAVLAPPDTWEVALSTGKDKKEAWTRLLTENKLGALALLRNLRNMLEVGVDEAVIEAALDRMKVDRVLPFRFVAAAKYAPRLEPAIERAFLRCAQSLEKFPGQTAILIDHSGSMQMPLSEKSQMTRFDAAGALAAILREVCHKVRVFTFSDRCIEVAPRRGFAMIDAVKHVINPVGTLLGRAVAHVYAQYPECERLIVVTDEQSADEPQAPRGRGYVINVGVNRNGIGYGPWLHIDGFSEAILNYIREYENTSDRSAGR